MKQYLTISIFLLWLASSFCSEGQALLTKNDSVRVKKDTTIQFFVKDFRGNVQWQKKPNGLTWSDMPGKTTPVLVIQPDMEAAYRAMVKEGSCRPVYSDTAFIIFVKASVSTNPVTSFSSNSAVCGGTVLDDGGAAVTARGVCWSISPDPTVSGNKTTNGQGPGTFTANLSGLTGNTPYFIRAYATNSKGTSYGNQVTFITKPDASNSITDIDGNVYQTVKIGAQTWMKENLRVTHAPDGSAIESTLCDEQNKVLYGLIYSWYTAMNGSVAEKAQGICPKGWHIPSDEEIKILEISLGMSRAVADLGNTWRGSPVGTLLKVGGSSGFEFPLGGLNSSPGVCYNTGSAGYLWSSTTSLSGNPWRRCFDTASSVGRWDTWPKNYGLSIRCVKD